VNETDELDRIWRDGLRHLALPTARNDDEAPMVTPTADRRTYARLAGSVTVAVLIAAMLVGVLTLGRHRDATRAGPPATTVAVQPVVVDVVDAPGNTLTLSLPGRTVSGQPPHVELPAGLIEFRIEMQSAGHVLEIDGVPDFAPTPMTVGTVTRTVRLTRGIYRLYCAIPGHAEVGEQMLLDVR
jgi:hypothetical protein